MKIEMGESLFYSWLRHEKCCQIVQTNWKASPQWKRMHEDELEKLWRELAAVLDEKFGQAVFGKNRSLGQILRQTECDAVGISVQGDTVQYYTVDVAFHEDGLNYGGTRAETVAKVVAKCIRTAFCLYGYMNTKKAALVFASPKITPSVLRDLKPCITLLEQEFAHRGFDYNIQLLCNEDFYTEVMKPMAGHSKKVADEAELFLRAYQLCSMFEEQ